MTQRCRNFTEYDKCLEKANEFAQMFGEEWDLAKQQGNIDEDDGMEDGSDFVADRLCDERQFSEKIRNSVLDQIQSEQGWGKYAQERS